MNLRQLFRPDEVIMGVEPPHHFFLMAGYYRLDGRIMKPAQVTRTNDYMPAGRGVYFRFRGLPQAKLQKIIEGIKAQDGAFTLSCTLATCSILQSAGLSMGDGKPPDIEPFKNFIRIMEHGFVDETGNKVNMEILASTADDLQHFVRSVRAIDHRVQSGIRAQVKEGGAEMFLDKIRAEHGEPPQEIVDFFRSWSPE